VPNGPARQKSAGIGGQVGRREGGKNDSKKGGRNLKKKAAHLVDAFLLNLAFEIEGTEEESNDFLHEEAKIFKEGRAQNYLPKTRGNDRMGTIYTQTE